MSELKHYRIEVFREDILVAWIECSWLPEDQERFAWNMGGDRIEIQEINPPQTP
jgi:hypothetical protein